MKIDSHQHFWKYSPEEYAWINDEMQILKNDFLPDNLRPLVRQAGFDGTVAVQARQSLDETRWLLRLAAENEFIKGVVGWVDLCSEKLENQLKELMSDPGFVGVRHVIQDEPDELFILRQEFLRGVGLLQKFNLTYDILIFAGQLPQTIEFVRKFPDQVFVLDHIAKPGIRYQKTSPWKEDMIKLAGFENVFCKISGMVTEADWLKWKAEDFRPYLDTVTNAFGTDRLMIGSDWPVCRLAGSYDDVMDIPFKYFEGFSRYEKEAIFGLNAKMAYHLKL
ncbi:MAG: amidohydrolase family protein [Bacteroidales bacterium]|nr:amidohydrolase family protein [Bacteroidales bacterium]